MLLGFAKNMRSAPTDAEHRLWQHLRATRLPDFKFRRQQPMGKYIVDFVCLRERLIVELDGGQHNESPRDLVRDAWLIAQGFKVLRFWNNEVFDNLEEVVERVLAQLQAAPTPQPLSHRGRGARSRSKADHASVHQTTNKNASFASLPPRGGVATVSGRGGTEGEGEATTKLSQKIPT